MLALYHISICVSRVVIHSCDDKMGKWLDSDYIGSGRPRHFVCSVDDSGWIFWLPLWYLGVFGDASGWPSAAEHESRTDLRLADHNSSRCGAYAAISCIMRWSVAHR